MIYLQLFWSFFQIGLFAFGGGYATLPLIENQVINHYHWLTNLEFNNLITISQMTPGPIAINSATFVGNKVGGIFGGIVATLGVITPSLIIVSILSYIYFKYKKMELMQAVLKSLRPLIIGLIASSGISIILSTLNITDIYIFNFVNIYLICILFIGIYLILKKKINPIVVMFICGFLKILIYYF